MVRTGVIEAFYGRQWPDPDRLAFISKLARLGLGEFAYAPKGDASLRRAWRDPFDQVQLERLHAMRNACHAARIGFGIGFTPLGLESLLAAGERAALGQKVAQIESIAPDALYILFDDLPSTGAKLAVEQLRIVEFMAGQCSVAEIVVCPSFYSTDPILEQVFGERPQHYWEDLGAGLDPGISLCWTGEKVCSETYSRENLEFIATAFQRKPVLWDNYPVNDSARLSPLLRLLPFSGREPWLADYTRAHRANPMNQPGLSLLPLASLPAIYGQSQHPGPQGQVPEAWGAAVEGEPAMLVERLGADAAAFQSSGLEGLAEPERQALRKIYSAFNSQLAAEVVAWLDGVYKFDPECLTV